MLHSGRTAIIIERNQLESRLGLQIVRSAALIFGIAGLAYLTWDVMLTLEYGVHLGTVLMALFALAVLYQSYALLRAKKGARWSAMFSAILFALTSAIILIVVIQAHLPSGISSIPTILWPMLGTLLAVTAAFGLAAVLLAIAKPPRT